MEDHEREGLTEFLEGLRLLLRTAVYEHPDRFPDELWGPMEAAWQEVEPLFGRVSDLIESRAYDEALEREGLAGDQLRFKLVGFGMALSELGIVVTRRMASAGGEAEDAAQEEASASETAQPTRPWRGARWLGHFKVGLDWGNLVVDSIGKVIPLAGAIGEFKKGVEAAHRVSEERSKPVWKRVLGL